MFSKTPGLHRTLVALFALVAVGCLLSCNSYNTNSAYGNPTFRAFVSNPVHPLATGGGTPALNIVNASTDQLSFVTVGLSSVNGSVTDAGLMALSPNHDRTL